jgi:hypothetical protein
MLRLWGGFAPPSTTSHPLYDNETRLAEDLELGALAIAASRLRFPLMGWSGRAPAPPASDAGQGLH